MLRSVTLDLNRPGDVYTTNVRPFLIKQEVIWSYWADFFQPSSEQQSLTFPMLERLCLDFSYWDLSRWEAVKLRFSIYFPCQISSKTRAEHSPLD